MRCWAKGTRFFACGLRIWSLDKLGLTRSQDAGVRGCFDGVRSGYGGAREPDGGSGGPRLTAGKRGARPGQTPGRRPGAFPRRRGGRAGVPSVGKRPAQARRTCPGVGSGRRTGTAAAGAAGASSPRAAALSGAGDGGRWRSQGRQTGTTTPRASHSSHSARATSQLQRSAASGCRTCGVVQPRVCFRKRKACSMAKRRRYHCRHWSGSGGSPAPAQTSHSGWGRHGDGRGARSGRAGCG